MRIRPTWTPYIAITAAFLIAFVWATTASSGSLGSHKQNFLIATAVAAAVSFAAIVLAALSALLRWRKPVRLLIALSVASFVFVVVLSLDQRRRWSTITDTLEETAESLAGGGPPYPDPDDVRRRFFTGIPASYTVGYWVAEDRQRFEVYFHRGSDSYTLAPPSLDWQWRHNRYRGPADE